VLCGIIELRNNKRKYTKSWIIENKEQMAQGIYMSKKKDFNNFCIPLMLLLISFLISSCSNENQITSDSLRFMGEELGKQVSNNGELYYDEEKGCYLKTKSGAIANCFLKTKVVFKIAVYCGEENIAALDGRHCGDIITESERKAFTKLCGADNRNEYFLNQENSYFLIDRDDRISALILTTKRDYLRDEGESEYLEENCKILKSQSSEKKLTKSCLEE
jgi:hypothetical protein